MHYRPTLFDRLLGDCPAGSRGAVATLTLEQLKDSVARDLEALLNTRQVLPPGLLDQYPHCYRSILNYGLVDFAGLCLSSDSDRASICLSLERAIARHEPRLRKVKATLEADPGAVNRLNFIITATLLADGESEPVNFNAVLQPSSLHYKISRLSRSSRG
jgi:type VI secretion system protein ImpF